MMYFAYGSNMNLGQMKARCPGAKKIANCRLDGYEICFPRKSFSREGRGVASICKKNGSHVEGVLFELTHSGLESLDEYEGVPESYTRRQVTVLINDKTLVNAETYVANPMEGCPFKPSKSYMEIIIYGAEENMLSKNYIQLLRKIEFED